MRALAPLAGDKAVADVVLAVVGAFHQAALAAGTAERAIIRAGDIGDGLAAQAPADFAFAADADAVVEEKLVTAGAVERPHDPVN